MTSTANRYCEVLGIKVPDLAVVKNSRDAECYAMLALLCRGRVA